jgi:hypothetical protein
MIDARINDKKNNPKKSTETKKGLGGRASSMTKTIDDDDSPF